MTHVRFCVALVGIFAAVCVSSHPDYHDALTKSIIFFEGQRSGLLPANQSIKWRSNSGVSDGSTENVDLTGGYYDAGDNVKFGLPMAFTTTMLAWGALEFGKRTPNELQRTHEAIRWATHYLLKASDLVPDTLYVQVGDAKADHNCWERPEDMDTPRTVYKVTPSNPGSEVAGETAAALAAASIVFKRVDPDYSQKLLERALKVFQFADIYRGSYNDSLGSVVCPFYCSYSGYLDELLWGAAWLFKATHDPSYLNYIQSLGANEGCDTFSWDNKLPGARVLLSRDSHAKDDPVIAGFRQQAEKFICSTVPGSPSLTAKYTPGGLLYKMNGSNLQYVTTTTFLVSTYANYLKSSKRTFNCGDLTINAQILRDFAKKQVDYILGDNPQNMSYMVGFGDRFPRRIHHRSSSLPSLQQHPEKISCDDGFQSYHSTNPNPNILIGAIVGGPDQNDAFADDRDNYAQSEPAMYINAPLVGPLSYFASKFRK